MESTSVYWIPLAELLEANGIEVVLVDARMVRIVPGRKSDVEDCQWLQKLHSCKPKNKKIRTARMWISCAGPRDGPWTVFDFTVTREAEGLKRFFEDYSGKIVCDAYSGYGSLTEKGITLYSCWAHTRRYYFNAYQGGDRKNGAEFVALIKPGFRS